MAGAPDRALNLPAPLLFFCHERVCPPCQTCRRTAWLLAPRSRAADHRRLGAGRRHRHRGTTVPRRRSACRNRPQGRRADLAQTQPVTLLLRKPPGHHTGQDGTPCDKAAPQLLSAATLWTEDGSSNRPLKEHFFQQTLCVPLETDAGGIVVFTQHWRVARKLRGCSLGQREIVINAQASAGGIVVVLAREAVWDYDTTALVEADQGLADKPAASVSPHRVSCLKCLQRRICGVEGDLRAARVNDGGTFSIPLFRFA